MLGLFGTLNLGARSLATQQAGTEVAGQNLANVNNPAYSRQRLAVETSPSIPTPFGAEGTGADAVAIVQLRSTLLDGQIQSQSSVTGSLNAQLAALQNAEANLGEQLDTSATGTSGSTSGGAQSGLAEQLSNLFNAFQNLSTDPSSISQRQVLLQTAQTLATQFNQVAGRLTDLRNGLNGSIQTDVAQSNQDLSDIASLNQQIINTEAATGGTANDLRDLREQKLEDLAGMVNITTTSEANGALDISIGGVTMVSGKATPDSLQTYDAGGGQLLIRAQTAGTPLTLSGGSIQGNISARDGELATLQGNTNTLAGQLISSVNAAHAAGYDLNGGTGQNFFTGTDAATIGVNAALVADPSKIQAAGAPGAAGDNQVALAMAQLANNNLAALGNQTFSQSYATTVAQLGQSIASANDQVTNQTAVTTMLGQQRAAVSGVSLDEEMTSLMQYQKAYEASAKLISTVSEMLTTLIGMKT